MEKIKQYDEKEIDRNWEQWRKIGERGREKILMKEVVKFWILVNVDLTRFVDSLDTSCVRKMSQGETKIFDASNCHILRWDWELGLEDTKFAVPTGQLGKMSYT